MTSEPLRLSACWRKSSVAKRKIGPRRQRKAPTVRPGRVGLAKVQAFLGGSLHSMLSTSTPSACIARISSLAIEMKRMMVSLLVPSSSNLSPSKAPRSDQKRLQTGKPFLDDHGCTFGARLSTSSRDSSRAIVISQFRIGALRCLLDRLLRLTRWRRLRHDRNEAQAERW